MFSEQLDRLYKNGGYENQQGDAELDICNYYYMWEDSHEDVLIQVSVALFTFRSFIHLNPGAILVRRGVTVPRVFESGCKSEHKQRDLPRNSSVAIC